MTPLRCKPVIRAFMANPFGLLGSFVLLLNSPGIVK